MGLDGIDMIFKLTTLDELDDVSNLNHSIWVWLMSQFFSGIAILDVGSITFSPSSVHVISDVGLIDYALTIL